MNCGPTSEFDRKVICSYEPWSTVLPARLTATRHRSDCGRRRRRDGVGPVPGLPRVDANTIHLPSGENAGSKLWTFPDGGVTGTQLAVSIVVMNTPSGSLALLRA